MSEEEIVDMRLIPMGVTGYREEPPTDMEQENINLRTCLQTQTATINYLKELAVTANLNLDPTKIIEPTIPSDQLNGWTSDKDQLLDHWKTQLFMSSYLYSYILEKYNRWFHRIQILSAILGAISTLLGVIITTLGSNDVWVNLGIGISIAIIGAIITVLTSIIKINGWDNYTESIKTLITNLDNLYAQINNESILPKLNRKPAADYIADTQKQLTQFTQNQPNISTTDYNLAMASYQKHQTQIHNFAMTLTN